MSRSTPLFVDLEDDLHATAGKLTGLSDFGPPSYRTGLKVLLQAFDQDPRFTDIGRQFAYGNVLGTLIARLHTQAGWKQRADSLRSTIVGPLVITGAPRTGTTALHKLLSMDSQFQGLEHWLAEAPMVRPPRASWPSLPQYQASVAGLEAFFKLAPEMRAAHDIVADEVDECLEILRQDFVSNRFASSTYVPSYDQWFQQQDERPSYRRFADVLKLIGAAEPDKRWLLKNPGHIATPEALLEIFPDACIVQTHRDPVKAIPSLCSVLHMSRRMFEGDAARAELIGPRELAYWSRAVDVTERVRAQRPQQFFDVDHRAFHTDPLGVVRGIYVHFDLTLSADTAARMRQWIARNPTAQHGEHRYDLESFGVGTHEIRRRFAGYIERYRLA
jgi:Sulfotransferase family